MFELPPSRAERHGDEPVDLSTVTPAWNAVIGRDGRPVGFRLAFACGDIGARAASATLATLLDAVLGGFVADGVSGPPHGLVVLAPHGIEVDASLRAFRAPRNVLLEVPQSELADDARVHHLLDAQRQGLRLALRVQNPATLPDERLPLFQYLVADVALYPKVPRDIALLATNVATRAEVDAAFAGGAHAVVGWPLEVPAPQKAEGRLAPPHRAVLELIRLVQNDADVAQIERAFRAEPVLAYLLLTLANSPAFMRGTPVASLSQAITLLGYKRLVKWLVLLMVIAAKDHRQLAPIYVAVARGFCMENLARACGIRQSDDCFVAGVFSLMDRVTGQSLGQLFSDLPLPAPVIDAVCHGGGPYGALLALARALERHDAGAVRSQARALELSLEQVNTALLQALAATDAIQSVV